MLKPPFLSKKRGSAWPVMKNTVIFLVAIAVFFSGILAIWVTTLEIPTLSSFDQRKVAQSTKIYDRTGDTLLYDVYQNIQRTVVPFEDISDHVKHASLAIEDPEFYDHSGIKPTAIARATFVNIASLGYEQGGSTITQQVVKNSLLTPEKTITRKLKEWILALKLERIKTKEEIFTIYLNEIPYGGSLYGIEEASQAYFDKPSSDLTITESAYLASLPKAPTRYLNNPDLLEARKNRVLLKMREHNYITAEEYREAKGETLSFSPKDDGIKAPHFVMYVLEQLEDEFGEESVRQGGLRVTTTLDYELQEHAQSIVQKHARQNEERFNAENASLIAIDPTNGDITVMVGSRNYFSEEINGQFNVGTSPNRQPGSTFKPFAYAAALQKGYTPDTVVFDAKTQFSTACPPSDLSNADPCYSPQNYDEVFRGPVSFREALAQSINIPSIKVLYLAGMDATLDLARRMGVTHLGDIRQYGLTLVLGGGEVSLLDMVSAYGVFANEGLRNEYRAILEVESSTGEILFEQEDTPEERVLPENIALQISDMLSDNAARTPAFGQNSYLHFPSRDVAVKTGTTNDYKDAWIIGYTPNLVVGTWAGNNDGSSMVKRVAGFIVAPMWNEFMNEALQEVSYAEFGEPLLDTGDDLKPILRGQWQSTGTSTDNGVHSILHWVDRSNPRGAVPSNPSRDSQYAHWEFGVRRWLERNIIDTTLGDDLTEVSTSTATSTATSTEDEED